MKTRIFAIVAQTGSEYNTISPVIISLNPNKLKEILKTSKYSNYYMDQEGNDTKLCFMDLDLDVVFSGTSCEGESYDLDYKYGWITYDGIDKEFTWRNKITNEFDPNFEDQNNPDYDNWEDGFWCKEYKDGILIKEYFDNSY